MEKKFLFPSEFTLYYDDKAAKHRLQIVYKEGFGFERCFLIRVNPRCWHPLYRRSYFVIIGTLMTLILRNRG